MTHRITALALACGMALVTATQAGAVSGGTEVPDPAAAPWMATVAVTGEEPLNQRAFCGGTLIAPDRVLTAGHCADGKDARRIEVYLGAADAAKVSGPGLPVRGVATHPGFGLVPSPGRPDDPAAAGADDDAAVLVLDRPVFDVAPVELARRGPAAGTPAVVFGHGLTRTPAQPGDTDVLRRGSFTTIDDATCSAELGGVLEEESMLCARGDTTATTVCPGDSGGPLMLDGTVQAGITSFGGEVRGLACGQSAPAAFTDVSRVRGWALSPWLAVAPVPRGPSVVRGEAAVGRTVTCEPPAWRGRPDTVTFQWYQQRAHDGFVFYTTIRGAVGSRFTVTADLAGSAVACRATATSAGGHVSAMSDAVAVAS
ncbi:serine protease [Amycolatopsis sp. NPDC006131]|uniref:S1 family peptidase n=1 Tax=Amycolatopsis sp. NPDC006131 TaxID=3156731 RepID=UPI0033B426C9